LQPVKELMNVVCVFIDLSNY